MIAVRDSISTTLIPSPGDLEVIVVNIGHPYEATLCTVYIPPSASVKLLIDYLSSLLCSSSRIVLVGDFNYPDINWSTLIGSTLPSNRFCEFIFSARSNSCNGEPPRPCYYI